MHKFHSPPFAHARCRRGNDVERYGDMEAKIDRLEKGLTKKMVTESARACSYILS